MMAFGCSESWGNPSGWQGFVQKSVDVALLHTKRGLLVRPQRRTQE